MQVGRIPLLFAIAFLLLAPSERALAQPDSAVTLTIRLLDHAPSFHVGEVIPLELVFSASGPESYEIERRNYDRSGRINMEQFHVTPAGRDPLKDYYARGMIMMGGIGGPRILNDSLWTIRADLNEWVALDNPARLITGKLMRGHQSMFAVER